MLDIDTINTINREEKEYRQWEQEERNRILRMVNPERKQKEWNKLFPKVERLSEDLVW